MFRKCIIFLLQVSRAPNLIYSIQLLQKQLKFQLKNITTNFKLELFFKRHRAMQVLFRFQVTIYVYNFIHGMFTV